MGGCDAAIRPFLNDTELRCRLEVDHFGRHEAELTDYAWPGSSTIVQWYDTDRRSYRGDWPGACDAATCSLPTGHRGGHLS